MRKNALAALLLLILMCVLTAGYGQARREPVVTSNKRIRLSPYGVLLSMPGPNGVGVTQLQYEGYLLALRVKNPKTKKEEELVFYAVGAQQTSANLEAIRLSKAETESVVQTTDKSIEITTRALEKNGVVEVVRRVLNTGSGSAEVLKAEQEIEIARLIARIACPMRGGLVFRGKECGDCQGCGCVAPNCTGGSNWAEGTLSFRTLENALPHRTSTSSASALPQEPTRQDIAVLTWSEGVNFKSITLEPGQSIQLREIITFNQ